MLSNTTLLSQKNRSYLTKNTNQMQAQWSIFNIKKVSIKPLPIKKFKKVLCTHNETKTPLKDLKKKGYY